MVRGERLASGNSSRLSVPPTPFTAEAVEAMAPFLLFIIYLLVATPLGLASRLIHDPLSRRRNRRATTYWTASSDSRNLPGKEAAEG